MIEPLCVVCKHEGHLGKGEHIKVIDGATARVCENHLHVSSLRNRKGANGAGVEPPKSTAVEVFEDPGDELTGEVDVDDEIAQPEPSNGRNDRYVPIEGSIERSRKQGLSGEDLRSVLLNLGYIPSEVNKYIPKPTLREVEKVLGRASSRRRERMSEAAEPENQQLAVERDALANALEVLIAKRSRLDSAISALKEILSA